MEITTLCAVVASLRVSPSRTQFFQYENFTLSCEQEGNRSEWKIKRNTSTQLNEDCPSISNEGNGSWCLVPDLYTSDSGVYWCESAAGCSHSINISVIVDGLILESSVLPVDEGEDVTLLCIAPPLLPPLPPGLTRPPPGLTHFYRDQLPVGKSLSGSLTLRAVSKSDEGLYSCSRAGGGGSAHSPLLVREAVRGGGGNAPLTRILLPMAAACLLLAAPPLIWVWRRRKGRRRRSVSYTEVTVARGGRPQRIAEVSSDLIFYSAVRLQTC
ncbi:uncharacterized protein ACNS7B_021241 [Menidia menidia]